MDPADKIKSAILYALPDDLGALKAALLVEEIWEQIEKTGSWSDDGDFTVYPDED